MAMPEEELIVRAATGDSDAFGALVAPHLGLFFNGILRMLGNRAHAQDALQEALLGIFRDLPDFQARSWPRSTRSRASAATLHCSWARVSR